MTEKEELIIKSYYYTDKEDLLVSIGRILLTNDILLPKGQDIIMASTDDRSTALERANEYIRQNWREFKERICNNETIQARMDGHMIELISVVADAIAYTSTGLPEFAVATILVKMGISNLCKENLPLQ